MGRIVDSSIFNFETYHPKANYPWGGICLRGLFLCLVFLGVWECFWRIQGYVPKIVDSYELWSSKHKSLYDNGENGFAMVGASRLMQAIDPDVLREEMPAIYPVQLGRSGGSPLPILKYMAEETDYNGTVVIDVTPRILFAEDAFSEKTIMKWIDRYQEEQKQSPRFLEPYYEKVELSLRQLAEVIFIFTGDQMNPCEAVKQFLNGGLQVPNFWEITGDRRQLMDYSGVDIEAFRKSRTKLAAAAKKLTRKSLFIRLHELNSYVEKIEERGGKVIFLKTPTTQDVKAAEEKRFPSRFYWDMLEKWVSGQKIDCNKIKNLSVFVCSDGAHIDSEQSTKFTTYLIDYIK
jgi:hypothetical protein